MARKIKHTNNPFIKAKVPPSSHATAVIPESPNIRDAVALHQQGQLAQAEVIYRQILTIEPRSADALHLLGVIAHQTGNNKVAVDLIDRAIEANPNEAAFYSNRGLALQELKQFETAVASYDRAISLKPDFAEAYSNRGNALQELKQVDAALASYDMAISLKPDYAEAYSNRGNALKELKKFETALASYDMAISLKPDFAETYSNRGVALKELKQFDAAIANYDKAIALKPNYAEAYSNRGVALKELKQFDAAIACYDKAIALKPNYAEAYSNRGAALQELKQFETAIANYDKAIALKPNYADAYSNRGTAFQELKQLYAAIASYDKALSLKPDFAEAYFNRGNVLRGLKEFYAAIASYDKAFSLKPDHDYLLGMRQHARMFISDWQDFESSVLKLNLKIQGNVKATSCLTALALLMSLPEHRKAAEIWSTDRYPCNPSLGSIPKRSKQAKIKIGYYSADFHNHATAYLIAQLFELHDKDKFEIIAFSFGPDEKDGMRNRIAQALDRFIDVTTLSDKAIAQLSREIGIDIAVDLKGLTQDCRLGIFSFKAALIQVSYLGYPGTLGTEYMDYLIADRVLIPPESQQYYSEKIVYLPGSYQVNDRKRVISQTKFNRQEMGLPEEGFVFCCFNNNYKITPPVFDVWVRILNAVEKSVLWLFEDNSTAATNLRKEAQRRGLDPARLVFAKRMDLPEHLARHSLADLFLDTLPYNAHTTASDALWAGLPVLTRMGESFASRVAGSLLHAIGLPELVTESEEDYEALAVELGTNPVKLKAIKAKLEKNRLTTPLFDTPLFAKHIEAAYTKMYERYQADLPPDHIYVEPWKAKTPLLM